MSDNNDRPRITREGDSIVVFVPIKFKRRRGRKEIILPPDGLTPDGPAAKPDAQSALVVAVARAHLWRDPLESGRVKSIAEIARANRVDGSDVSRVLDLTLLAPDIIEAILDGREPSGLSFNRLTRGEIPVLWEEQRRAYGFRPAG